MMQTFTVVKLVVGLMLIVLALPRLEWSTGWAMLFSSTWLLFAICYVIANWRAWRKTGETKRLQKEYRWRLAWFKRRKQKGLLDRSY